MAEAALLLAATAGCEMPAGALPSSVKP